MVNIPKLRKTYCPHPDCRSHKLFKVNPHATQYCGDSWLTVCLQVTQHKKSAESKNAQGRRRYGVVTDHLVTLVTCHDSWIVTPCDAVTWRCSAPQVRPQAAGLRRPVQAHPEEEGQDHQEAGAEARVHGLQVEEPGSFHIITNPSRSNPYNLF